jgi:hypothetical protein
MDGFAFVLSGRSVSANRSSAAGLFFRGCLLAVLHSPDSLSSANFYRRSLGLLFGRLWNSPSSRFFMAPKKPLFSRPTPPGLFAEYGWKRFPLLWRSNSDGFCA